VAAPIAHPLRRILGLGFGVAFVFGTVVGVGILRLPGEVAAALGDRRLIVAFWVLGGIYALLGACAVAELAAMLPESGGFRVYARRAYGNGCGFLVGWCDWLANAATIAYLAITTVTFLETLLGTTIPMPRIAAVAVLAIFMGLHWIGARVASAFTTAFSVAVGAILAVLIGACFVAASSAAPGVHAAAAISSHPLQFAAVVAALRSILVTYDGWYAPIYMAEENTDPTRTLPRAMIGGALLVAALYVIINVALLLVLPLPQLAASTLPAADAARLVLPRGGALLIAIVSFLMVLSCLHNVLLMGTRVLFAIGRDGLFTRKAGLVSASGTPRVALLITTATSALLIMTGTFEQTVALCAILYLLYYASAFLGVFVLRFREPALPRPYRAFGYPATTGIVLVGTVIFLVAAVAEDPRSGLIAAGFLIACVPLYLWIVRVRSC